MAIGWKTGSYCPVCVRIFHVSEMICPICPVRVVLTRVYDYGEGYEIYQADSIPIEELPV